MNELRREEYLKVAVILGIVILLVYGDVAFMGYTLSQAVDNEGVLFGTQYGYAGRRPNSITVLDPLSTGGQIEPILQLIVQRFYSGHLPLWNPYQGTGAPLAGDPTWSTYFPTNLLYFIPNNYWDYVELLKLWVASMFTYLLLKRFGLSKAACMGGAFAYSLSGALVVNPFVPWTDIAIMTPAVLLVVKRCIDNTSRQSIALTSVVVSITLLGAHVETLVIQFLFVGWFAMFEIITRKGGRIKSLFRLLPSVALGFGIAAFFLFPVFEHLLGSTFAHGAGVGLQSLSTKGLLYTDLNPAFYWIALFVPYFYGFFQTYPYPGLRHVFFWDVFPGYVGTTVLFLSLLPLFLGRFRDPKLKYYWFFLVSEILILMKNFGVPPINWIGYLPVLTFLNWRYSGSILALSFAGAAAFGVESARRVSKWRALGAVSAAAILITAGIWASLSTPVMSLSGYFPASLGYLVFSLGALALSGFVASKGGSTAPKVLVIFIVLELAAYIPRSLAAEYEVGRIVILSVAGLLTTAIAVWPIANLGRIGWPFHFRFPNRRRMLAVLLIAAMILQFAIASASPVGLPNRYDAFTAAPYVRFLQLNTGFQRVFSTDGLFLAPVAGIFSVQDLGEFSAYVPSSFEAFATMNLDPGIVSTIFLGNGFYRQGNVDLGNEIHNNLAFYSLLGVKYFVTTNTDPGLVYETLLQPENEGNFGWIPIGNNSISTDFVTDKSFDGLALRLGTYGRINQGDVLLTLDSTSTNVTVHRVARLPAESISNGAWENEFTFPNVEVASPTEFRVNLSQSDTEPGNELAVMWYPQAKQDPDLWIENRSLNLAMGLIQRDETLPIAYRDQNATIYQNLRMFPRAFLVNQIISANSLEDALNKTRKLGWGTRDSLVIEGITPELTRLKTLSNASGSAEIELYSPEEVDLQITASNPSCLVLTDTFYPGWNAYVDDKPVNTYRAYGLVRAVFVTAGSHKVSFKYEPNSFKIGAYISILSAVAVVMMLLPNGHLPRKARSQRSIQGPPANNIHLSNQRPDTH